MDDAAVIHHRDRVAERARDPEILLDQQDGGAPALQLLERLDQHVDDRRREALGRLVDQHELARLDQGARDRQHLLLTARERARRQQPEFLERREQPEDPAEPRVVERAIARGQHHVLLDREAAEHAHRFGHVGDAEPGHVGGRQPGDVAALERQPAGRGAPQPHDGAQGRGLAGAIAAEQHGEAACRHREIGALHDMITADMGVDAGQLEQRVSHGDPS